MSLHSPAQSEAPRTSRNNMHENRETASASLKALPGRFIFLNSHPSSVLRPCRLLDSEHVGCAVGPKSLSQLQGILNISRELGSKPPENLSPRIVLSAHPSPQRPAEVLHRRRARYAK
jgi:hypothetical protein